MGYGSRGNGYVSIEPRGELGGLGALPTAAAEHRRNSRLRLLLDTRTPQNACLTELEFHFGHCICYDNAVAGGVVTRVVNGRPSAAEQRLPPGVREASELGVEVALQLGHRSGVPRSRAVVRNA